METLNDARLVELSRDGDRDAFGRIVERYQSLICSLTYSACGNLQSSEDLAQVTFITAWCQLKTLREPSKLKSWLCRIARNLMNNSLNKDHRSPTASAEPLDAADSVATEATTPRDYVISKEEQAILWRSLSELPETYREPLVLFYRQQQSVAEVAGALELSEDVVRQRLTRGRTMLSEKVTKFVEGALRQTSPGNAFTLGVLAALPGLTLSAKAATLGAAAAKGSATAKAAAATGMLAAILGPLFVFIGSYAGYRIGLDDARSDEERGLIKSFYRKIGAWVTGIFVAFAAFAFWLCRNQSGPSLLITLLFAGLCVIYLLTTFVFAVASVPRQRRFYSRVLTQAHAGNLPAPAWEYRSRFCLLGLPLVHICIGDRFDVLKGPVKAWIAVGNYAIGALFAFGGLAIAPLSIGWCAIGLLPFGGIAIGLFALGGFGLGVWTYGGLALGWMAYGGCAIAWKAALGGIALAHEYALGGIAYGGPGGIEAAKAFIQSSLFFDYTHALAKHFVWLNLLWVVPLLTMWRTVACGLRRGSRFLSPLRKLIVMSGERIEISPAHRKRDRDFSGGQMKKQAFLVVLVLVVIGTLALVIVRQRSEIASLRQAAEFAAAKQTEPARQPAATAQQPEPELPVEVVPTPPPPAPIEQPSSGSPSNFFSGLAGMMKNPQMKEVMRMQQKMMLEQSFGPMFKSLNRPENEVDALKDLLLQRQLALMDAGMSAMSGSDEERKAAAETTKTLKEDCDKKIKDLLDPQDYEVFQQYDQTAPERMQIQMFKGTLPADAMLTDQQESDLIAAMYEERKAIPPSSLMNNKSPDPSQFTEENIAEALKQMEQLQQRYAERAAAILTPAQLEQFTKWQQQISTMQAAGLKMAAQMFGSKPAQPAPAGDQSQGP
jgi:RNA polymerase sigma factor (sigma-70 family)